MSKQACTILIADDDSYVRDDLKDVLDSHYELLFASTAKEAWTVAFRERPDLILLDIRFPDLQDLTLLQRIKREIRDSEVIMLTGQTENVAQIVSAIKMGAFDYVSKPYAPDELKNRVAKALELRALSKCRERMVGELKSRSGAENLVGESGAIKTLRESIERLAGVDGCVLIRGESGTGKELVARALHYSSKRASNPFIAVNCASIPEALLESVLFGHRKGAFTGAIESSKGKFEVAEDGTVFLDEIGDMPISQQTSLLRVLEYRFFTPVGEHKERECRARFVLATNRDLRERVRDKLFREDLYYRINVASLTLPALRTRPEDIGTLVEHYNLRLSAELGRRPIQIHPEVLSLFEKYDWPGNVRELKHVLEGSLMLIGPDQMELTLKDLPPELLAARNPTVNGTALSIDDLREKEEIIRALKQCNGNQSQAAKLLGVHRNTIRTKIRYWGLGNISVDPI